MKAASLLPLLPLESLPRVLLLLLLLFPFLSFLVRSLTDYNPSPVLSDFSVQTDHPQDLAEFSF